MQARSSARLTGLLDAAAGIIDEIGFERLTTAMVAERAGASIGTVYRYFPDRIAVVEALAARSIARLLERLGAAIGEADSADWHSALDLAITAQVEMYRSEPGFRAIRFSETETADRSGDADARRSLSDQLTSHLVEIFSLERTADLEFSIEVATEMSTSLVARAFLHDPQGDSRFLDESRVVVAAYLERIPSA